jgi:hypothetical protein
MADLEKAGAKEPKEGMKVALEVGPLKASLENIPPPSVSEPDKELAIGIAGTAVISIAGIFTFTWPIGLGLLAVGSTYCGIRRCLAANSDTPPVQSLGSREPVSSDESAKGIAEKQANADLGPAGSLR